MEMAHMGLVHCNSCGCNVKDFNAVSSNKKKVQRDICKDCNSTTQHLILIRFEDHWYGSCHNLRT